MLNLLRAARRGRVGFTRDLAERYGRGKEASGAGSGAVRQANRFWKKYILVTCNKSNPRHQKSLKHLNSLSDDFPTSNVSFFAILRDIFGG